MSDGLLEKGLIACVNIMEAAESRYIWKGKITSEKEWVLIMKGPTKHMKKISKHLQQQHPYECPCFLALASHSKSDAFALWVLATCTSEKPK